MSVIMITMMMSTVMMVMMRRRRRSMRSETTMMMMMMKMMATLLHLCCFISLVTYTPGALQPGAVSIPFITPDSVQASIGKVRLNPRTPKVPKSQKRPSRFGGSVVQDTLALCLEGVRTWDY